MTDVSAERFGEIAKLAVHEGSASREELGRSRAAEFLANPNTFDPQKLILLGRTGLRAFADVMGAKSTLASTDKPPETEPISIRSAETGWNNDQAPNIPFEFIGAMIGVLSGVFLIAVISLRVWLDG